MWSPATIEGAPVGKIALVMSKRRIQETNALLDRVRTTAGGFGLLALVVGVLFVYFATRAIQKRDQQLASYASGLEAMVETRTRALDARNQGMRVVLDNVEQGLMTIEMSGRVASERSRAVEVWFGDIAENATLMSLISTTDPRAAEWIGLGLGELVEDCLPAELVIDQMPKSVRIGDRVLRMAFRPIADSTGKTKQMLVVLTDITSELERDQADSQQRELLALFRTAVTDPIGFAQFWSECARLVDEVVVAAQISTPVIEKRLVHTLKGNTALYGAASVAAVCHTIEDRINETGEPVTELERARLRTAWSELAGRVEPMLGTRSGYIEVRDADYERLTKCVAANAPQREIAALLASWRDEPVAKPLERLARQAETLATRLDKGGVEIVVEADDSRLPPVEWQGFWGALVHAVRNALDHGVEEVGARKLAGKHGRGKLVLAAKNDGDSLLVSIRDDGNGVDFARVAEKARAAGLPADTHEQLVAALFADGMTTREQATDVSGRGIGMSALRDEVTRRGGTIDVVSMRGEGTRVDCRFPRVRAAA